MTGAALVCQDLGHVEMMFPFADRENVAFASPRSSPGWGSVRPGLRFVPRPRAPPSPQGSTPCGRPAHHVMGRTVGISKKKHGRRWGEAMAAVGEKSMPVDTRHSHERRCASDSPEPYRSHQYSACQDRSTSARFTTEQLDAVDPDRSAKRAGPRIEGIDSHGGNAALRDGVRPDCDPAPRRPGRDPCSRLRDTRRLRHGMSREHIKVAVGVPQLDRTLNGPVETSRTNSHNQPIAGTPGGPCRTLNELSEDYGVTYSGSVGTDPRRALPFPT
jgi:hypothetical protein